MSGYVDKVRILVVGDSAFEEQFWSVQEGVRMPGVAPPLSKRPEGLCICLITQKDLSKRIIKARGEERGRKTMGIYGVGKTSLVYGLAHSEVLRASSWTIGCSVEVVLHDHKNLQQPVCVELLDVGGSTSHKNSRSIFYNGINGIILVHDLSNRKSYLNLKGWLSEALSAGKQELTGILVRGNQSESSGYDNDPEQLPSNTFPTLIVGTKLDQVTETRISNITDSHEVLDLTNAESIRLSCLEKKSFTPGSGILETFSDFFDKVIEKRTSAKTTFSPSRVMQREFPSMVFSRTTRTKF